MRTVAFVLAIAALAFSKHVSANEEIRAQCERYAVEENIRADEIEQYIDDCMLLDRSYQTEKVADEPAQIRSRDRIDR